jgi:hypothetical protein
MALSYCGPARSGEHFQRLLPEGGRHLMGPIAIIRVIPLEEVAEKEYYSDMADLATIFNHEIVEMGNPENPTWRWKPNSFIDWIQDYAGVYTPSTPHNLAAGDGGFGRHCDSHRASLCLNTLSQDLHCGAFSMEEWMKFYMQIGYSLCGFGEVFGQHEASDYGLPNAHQRGPDDDPDEYVETVIEYMRRIHRGEVLKL